MNIKEILTTIGLTISKHQHEILTGLSIAGVVTTAIFGVKDTIAAQKKIEKEKATTTKEKFKAAWTCYIPTTVMGCLTIGCIVCNQILNAKHTAALVSAYTLSENTLKTYQNKVIEHLGEKKEKTAIQDQIDKDLVNQIVTEKTPIVCTGTGETLCLDSISGRVFKSDIEYIKKCENDFNAYLYDAVSMTLNEWYAYLGLSDISIGNYLGWCLPNRVKLKFSSQLTYNNIPCLVIGYDALPYNLYEPY